MNQSMSLYKPTLWKSRSWIYKDFSLNRLDRFCSKLIQKIRNALKFNPAAILLDTTSELI